MCPCTILMQLLFCAPNYGRQILGNLGSICEFVKVGIQGLCVFCSSHNSPPVLTGLPAFSDAVVSPLIFHPAALNSAIGTRAPC